MCRLASNILAETRNSSLDNSGLTYCDTLGQYASLSSGAVTVFRILNNKHRGRGTHTKNDITPDMTNEVCTSFVISRMSFLNACGCVCLCCGVEALRKVGRVIINMTTAGMQDK